MIRLIEVYIKAYTGQYTQVLPIDLTQQTKIENR